MRLITFADEEGTHLGLLRGDNALYLQRWAAHQGAKDVPGTMLDLIARGARGIGAVLNLVGGCEDDVLDAAGALRPVSEVKLLAPIPRPLKNVFCLGLNYAAHAQESNMARNRDTAPAPQYPTIFSKTPTTVNSPYGDVVIDPAVSEEVDWEVELGVIIGRKGKNIKSADALDYVFGYTVINDVSARDIQVRHGGQFFKGKSLDGYCPMGPCIVTTDELGDPQKLHLQLRVNGVTKQDGNTSDMIFDVASIIEWLSQGMTLEPGDVIATGTPAGVGFARKPPEFLHPGDVMETEIERIGVLRNKIVGV